jgi:hypothetical protein
MQVSIYPYRLFLTQKYFSLWNYYFFSFQISFPFALEFEMMEFELGDPPTHKNPGKILKMMSDEEVGCISSFDGISL